MPIKNGRLEVAIAVAMTSNLVKVDASVTPFQTIPPNLFDLQFNDDEVRINDGQMPLFKANLRKLLPEIAEAIEEIPDNSNLLIEQVAVIVKFALLAEVVEALSLATNR
jgi:hypothetical protein